MEGSRDAFVTVCLCPSAHFNHHCRICSFVSIFSNLVLDVYPGACNSGVDLGDNGCGVGNEGGA